MFQRAIGPESSATRFLDLVEANVMLLISTVHRRHGQLRDGPQDQARSAIWFAKRPELAAPLISTPCTSASWLNQVERPGDSGCWPTNNRSRRRRPSRPPK